MNNENEIGVKAKKHENRFIIPNDKIGLIIALAAIVAIFSFWNPNYFSKTNFVNILIAASLTGLVAIGETFLIIAGLVDLSAGSVAAFASVLAAVLLQAKINMVATIILVIIAGLFAGYLNALAVNKIKLEPFIATLATMSIVRGIAYIICGGNPVYIMNYNYQKISTSDILGLPIPVVILIVAFVIFGIVLAKTGIGRSIYVVGGNKYAARLAGLEPQRITAILFMITGGLSALGGIVLAARMSSGQPAACVGLEFDAITAAVLGGTAFSGGVGTIFGTVLGVLILQGFNTGLIMMNVQVFWQYIARGLLLLVALAFDYLRKRNREKKLLEQSMANNK